MVNRTLLAAVAALALAGVTRCEAGIFSGSDNAAQAVQAQPNLPKPVAIESARPMKATEGVLWREPGRVPDSSFTVEAPPGRLNYMVQLIKEPEHVVTMIVYCGAGRMHTVAVPTGSYTVTYAYGEKWYGFPRLFGAETGSETLGSYMRFDETAPNGLKFGPPVPANSIGKG